MLSERELSAAIGSTAYDGNGGKIGTVEHFYVDDRTGAPTWVALTTGLFGTSQSVAPATDASFADGDLRLPVSADAVKNAPSVAGDHLDPQEEAELRRHYGLGGDLGTDLGTDAGPRLDTGTGHDTDRITGRHARPEDTDLAAAPTQEIRTDPPPVPAPPAETDGAMTRSEEQVRVGMQQVATTRVRLVKHVVTEDVQITVPIRREEIRVEHVPVDAVDDGPGESLTDTDTVAPTGGRLPDEIVLHTERPVVTVEVVPVERVRLRTEIVDGQETITEQVQREQIVVDETPAPGVSSR